MSEAQPRAVRFRVTGRVQGVSFRAGTVEEARRLGVTGWVRNAPDGAVEGLAEGPAEAVEALVAWAHHGPSYASVEDVEIDDVDPSGATGFEVRW